VQTIQSIRTSTDRPGVPLDLEVEDVGAR
jgi:hypothetical protein